MSLYEQAHAMRHSVALSWMDHVGCLRVSGDGAYEALDRLVPAELYIQDGQMLHSLVLDRQARPLADLYVCRDDEDFFLLTEGLSPAEMQAFFLEHVPGARTLEMEALGESHRLISLNGPFAWELLADLAGPEVVGMPYLSLAHIDQLTCFRAGKTGEYGYDLLVPEDLAEDVFSRLVELGQRFDLGVAGLEALDLGALEGWFFNIRREGQADVTPIELQQQWRVSYRKEYVGSEALATRRREGPARRLCCLVSEEPLELGGVVQLEDRSIGEVVNADVSFFLEQHLGLALIDMELAFPGIDSFTVNRGGRPARVRTITPPALNNRSLHVSPQAHSYATRDEFTFPPLNAGCAP